MIFVFFLSIGILKPAWEFAWDNSDNSTISISPFCSMSAVFDDDFYEFDVAIRMFTPLIGESFYI